jgi:hypothetical protein
LDFRFIKLEVVMDDNDEHPAKQFFAMNITELEITIDDKDEHP